MSSIVGAAAVPHTPFFPMKVAHEGDQSAVGAQYGRVRTMLEQTQPDLVVLFDSDHVNTFFLDNLPTFAVGVARRTSGPNDLTEGLPFYDVPVDEVAGRLIHAVGVNDGFDLSVTQEFTVDHSVLVPLHFLTPGMTTPVVPVFINGLVPPVPRSQRAFGLGQAVARAVAGLPGDRRVAVVSSGTVSHEIGGPRVRADAPFGVPDPSWVERVMGLLEAGDPEALVAEATTERMFQAGDVAAELLNLIAVLGAIGSAGAPDHLEPDMELGHLFAAWKDVQS